MLAQSPPKIHTPEEYRQLEATAEFRHEYRDGVIVKMPGGTINHNRITGNVYAFLKFALRGKDAEPFTSDLRLWIPQFRRGTYPDVMVIRGEPIFHEGRQDEVLNPSLIVEVLSKSTEEFDLEDKFRFYRSIPQFCEYVLINQYEFWVQHYLKTDARQWLFQDYTTAEDTVSLGSIDVEISLCDIYEGIKFSSEAVEG
ncbi:MAG TPA: Uma2 family endonuclease [Oscillatoriales cyanobacterium M59_W2019_021]|nr:MAG: Uma2 family endonuclease [Cyanobacteria bacterium J055]HIK30129.1 Uma2 family endonuclease [Oscillatoriales cyanobacterium M4454_W2019_049]HIK52263.1 Uma2 family endonuclease [Oscillatoriales cyanobacterium M59_W2019_021]